MFRVNFIVPALHKPTPTQKKESLHLSKLILNLIYFQMKMIEILDETQGFSSLFEGSEIFVKS